MGRRPILTTTLKQKRLPAALGLTAVALQARLASSRLPQKCLLPLGNGSVLSQALRRLRTIKADYYLILTDNESRASFEKLGMEFGFQTLTGDPDDVLSRYVHAAKTYKLDTLIRATGDNPWVFTDYLPGLARMYAKTLADYAVHTELPYGAGVELVRAKALLRAGAEARRTYDREHVCPYLYGNPEIFRIFRKSAPLAYRFPQVRLTIDTQEDYQFARAVALAIGDGLPSDNRLLSRAKNLRPDWVAK